MKECLSSYLRRKFGESGTSRAEKEVHTIHEIAREIFSTDFPNPERAGCLPKESFGKLIVGKHLPVEELQNHLLACSECFNEYRSELLRTKSAPATKKNISPLVIRVAFAGGMIAVLIVVGSLFWFRQTTSNSPEIAQNKNLNSDAAVLTDASAANSETDLKATVEHPPPVIERNNTNAKPQINSTTDHKNERKSPVKKANASLLAKNDIEIDLNDPVWRDSSAAGTTNQKVVRLEAKKARIRVKLPKENPKGIYQVFLVDEFARALTEKKTIRTKNQTLSVEFDLGKISGNQRRLCFAPVGEIPDCVLVNVVPLK
jgi:hypothetical protein